MSVTFLDLSKDNSFFVLLGSRKHLLSSCSIKNFFNFFELVFSPFISKRLYQNRYFQTRLLILKELKNMNINPSNIKISMSHNKDDFVALISKKDTKMAIDFEQTNRKISYALDVKISQIQKPDSLSSLGFINMIETLVKITNKKWLYLIENIEVKKMHNFKDVYKINFENETIYSRFYSYNGNQICISSYKFGVLQ